MIHSCILLIFATSVKRFYTYLNIQRDSQYISKSTAAQYVSLRSSGSCYDLFAAMCKSATLEIIFVIILSMPCRSSALCPE
jgi:hypothetical protein